LKYQNVLHIYIIIIIINGIILLVEYNHEYSAHLKYISSNEMCIYDIFYLLLRITYTDSIKLYIDL